MVQRGQSDLGDRDLPALAKSNVAHLTNSFSNGKPSMISGMASFIVHKTAT